MDRYKNIVKLPYNKVQMIDPYIDYGFYQNLRLLFGYDKFIVRYK